MTHDPRPTTHDSRLKTQDARGALPATSSPHPLIPSSLRYYCRRDGQASLEMTVALIGALILLFGTLKVFLWVNTRLIQRQQSYETTRATGGDWQEPSAKLRIFE